MALLVHVNGPAQINLASTPMGISDAQGVTVDEVIHKLDVYCDNRGSKVPQEIINLGHEVSIKGNFAYYDNAVVNSFEALSKGGSLTSMGTIGELQVAGGRMSSITILSALDNHARTYNRAYLVSIGRQLSVSENVTCPFEIRAFADASGVVQTVANPAID